MEKFMKNYRVIALVTALAGLSACATLSKQDSDRIARIERMAEDAKQQSTKAVDEAKNARKAADKASAKADRIFKESQNK